MVCGIDIYHDRQQGKAVSAFVASLNPSFSRYYSSVDLHDNTEENVNSSIFHIIINLI